jgi:hypothetical protein
VLTLGHHRESSLWGCDLGQDVGSLSLTFNPPAPVTFLLGYWEWALVLHPHPCPSLSCCIRGEEKLKGKAERSDRDTNHYETVRMSINSVKKTTHKWRNGLSGISLFPNETWSYYFSTMFHNMQTHETDTVDSKVDFVDHWNTMLWASLIDTEIFPCWG